VNYKMIKKLGLFTPPEYLNATPNERRKVVNGCGTSGWKGLLVPETLWGLSVTESCDIHDWMYHHGETLEDKEKADRVFLNNMVRTINHQKSWRWLKKLRLHRAKIYHMAVADFGGAAFWEGKN